MQFFLFVALFFGTAVAGSGRRGTMALRKSTLLKSSSMTKSRSRDAGDYGSSKCPCIGFDNLDGETEVTIKKGEKTSYPADLGGSCDAWDDEQHPDCDKDAKDAPSWCKQEWCYVDPKNCHLDVLPKKSAYLPKAKFQGLPVHFSYATCGGKDTWSQAVPEYGTSGCRCIGIDNSPGTTMVKIGEGKRMRYPAEVGGECKAWDEDRHPDCQGDDAPSWCKSNWCFVDPCSCDHAVPPKLSVYLADATFQGRPIYYSYATCGAKDTWTSSENKAACVNQATSKACGEMEKCAWDGKRCLGKDLVKVCGKDEPKSAEPRVREPAAKSGATGSTQVLFWLPLLLLLTNFLR